VLVGWAVWAVTVAGCGQMIQPPTPTAVEPTPSDAPRATATRRPTFTPVPATPSDTPTPTVTPTPIIYVVQAGDTLLAIARKFDTRADDIQEANGITDPRRLRIGQELIIPLDPGDDTEPTPYPTPTPVRLEVRGLAFYPTPTGTMWCLGEVENLSGAPAEETAVEVSLHDTEGTLLAQAAAFTELDIIAPGARAPFAILFTAPPTTFAQYQVRVVSAVPSLHLGPRYTDLAVTEDTGEWQGGTRFVIQGRIQNTGSLDAAQVRITATGYDAEGHVVASRTVGLPVQLFQAGAIAPFDVELQPMAVLDRYAVQVQGWQWRPSPPPVTVPPEGTTPAP
jgi:LysM repeat protein